MPPSSSSSADSRSISGQWSELVDLPNVPIHTHVLPNGEVLFWGRREPAATNDFPSLNQHSTSAFLWNPAIPDKVTPTGNQPVNSQGFAVNLFCSGHTFLPDGRLFVTGGHLFDSQGTDSAVIYDTKTNQWTAEQPMNLGRWYPTAITLPDGSVLVCSGSYPTGPLQPPPNQNTLNTVPQIWKNRLWTKLTDFTGLPLYPRMHVAPDGRVFMAGGLAQSFFFDTSAGGTWIPGPFRSAAGRDYAPSVMYDVGKIIFIGGGLDVNGDQNGPPTNMAEIIDLNILPFAWTKANPMQFARRQHNATLLPDGTVLVTGGTQGGDFNNLEPGNPVHVPEIWDPSTGIWTALAAESEDRCYHSTAVLLPDGRVLSAGGGEYAPGQGTSNLPRDSHSNGQIFSPPYLFKGKRPVIIRAPDGVLYGEEFVVETPVPDDILQVTWIRLPSVTHSFDQNQRINFLLFKPGDRKLLITAPHDGNICPPGHYMLFLLNQNKVPSVAHMILVAAPPVMVEARNDQAIPLRVGEPEIDVQSLVEKDAAIQQAEQRPAVVIGVTPTCPYGISACWGGAYEALQNLHGVRLVRPLPNAEDSTAFVYLAHNGLPDIDIWPDQFANIANGIHHFRGVEVTLKGVVKFEDGNVLSMLGSDVRPPLILQPLVAKDKIQWDIATGSLKPLTASEEAAYSALKERILDSGGALKMEVTGPLKKSDRGYIIEVRIFSIADVK